MIARALAVLLLLSVASCSWLFVTPPPSTPPRYGGVRCTETRAAPVLDTLIAVPSAIVALAGLAAIGESNDGSLNDELGDVFGTMFLIGGGLSAALYGSSAIYGYTRTSRCRDMKAQQWQLQQNPPAPQPATPGPGPWGTPPPRR